jgi:hypothetical protein
VLAGLCHAASLHWSRESISVRLAAARFADVATNGYIRAMETGIRELKDNLSR